MSAHLTPLEVVECLICPIDQIGQITGHHEKTPRKWRRSSAWRGAGDIPHEAARSLLAYSKKRSLGLTADHLLHGASRESMKVLLVAHGRKFPRHLRERTTPQVAAE